jgi:exodeoxyribonuclease V gamma subunit
VNAGPDNASGWHTLTTMLHLHRAERADRLADALAEILSTPTVDPFTPEVIAVPTRGMERWLTQRLSARLGVSDGRGDGVCANIDFPFPGRLIGGAIAVASGVEPDDDPWPPERSVWPLLSVIEECRSEPWFAHLAPQFGGQRRFGQLRLTADLFDHYGVRRPGMLRAWARGEDVDGSGAQLTTSACWQPELWRRLRATIGSDSPAERLDTACARLREDPGLLELPDRMSLFGLTRLPASYVQALSALATGRELHLFLLHPSPALWRTVAKASDHTRELPRVRAGASRARAGDTTARLAENRLLRSWGADSRELQLVLTAAGEHADHHHSLEAPAEDTLLHRVQADVIANRPPPGPPIQGETDQRLQLTPTDRSIEIHACHGPARQVEVLREAIMHLLAENPTLEPRDVIVMCPDIETFAPLIQATFGSTSLEPMEEVEPGRTDLRVRLADRSLRQTNPILAAVARLIELTELRLTASQLIDLAASEPVRRRFRFSDDDLARIQDWIVECGIRWGLDAAHRVTYNLEEVPAGTWRAGLRRLLLGVAMSESGREQFGQVLPLDDVESGDIELAGRFAEFVERVGVALDSFAGPQTTSSWAAAISEAADSLTHTSDRDAWQRYELRTLLADVVTEAGRAAGVTEIELAELRSLLRHRLAGRPTRANFRTGHLTVCTLVPMRSVPHRVVCLLGLDDGAFPRRTARDGDDLLLDAPHVGDRDPRTEDRQLLLDALLAAEDRLLILFSGADERTNAPRPPAVPVGELLDTIDRTARVSDGRARDEVTVHHPLQSFDPKNFEAGTLVPGTRWGFDRSSLQGARALMGSREPPPPFLPAELPKPDPSAIARVELDELIAFAERPVRAFMRQRLGISTSETEDEIEDGLPVELDGLARWRIGQRVLDGMLAGYESRVCFDAERARGALPPGKLGKPVADSLVRPLGSLLGAAKPYTDTDARSVGINLSLPGGRRLTGSVSGIRGNVLLSVQFSRLNARHRMAAWIRLLALTAHDPEQPYEAVTIGRAPHGSYAQVATARIAPLDGDPARRRERALTELAALVELRDRGLREPLPITPNSSAAYAAAVASSEDPVAAAEREWASTFKFPREDAEPEHVRAFGAGRPFAELLELVPAPTEVGPGWPADESTRFGRCARRLWDPLLAAERLNFS